MMKCNNRETLEALLSRPTVELFLVGAEEDNDEDDLNDDDNGESGDGDDGDDKDDKSGDGDGDDNDDEDDDKDDPKDRRIKNLEEERDRHYAKRKAAETKVTSLEAEISRLKKDGTTDEATKTQLSTLEADNKSMSTRIADMALENAFLKDNSHTWHDPDAALRLADLSKVEIDDDGVVHGLGDALESLASNKSYLLNAEKPERKQKPKKSGDKSGNKGGGGDSRTKSAKEATRKAELQSKYPGLRR